MKALWKRNPTMVISERFVICRGRKKWFKMWSLGVYGKLRKKWGQCSWNFSLLSITARDIWVASLCTKSENLKLFSSWIIFIWSKHHFDQIWSQSKQLFFTLLLKISVWGGQLIEISLIYLWLPNILAAYTTNGGVSCIKQTHQTFGQNETESVIVKGYSYYCVISTAMPFCTHHQFLSVFIHNWQ